MNQKPSSDETPWQIVGRYIRLRRERLDLKQDDLKARRGPGSSTVRKAELATFPDGIPQGTQHALEKALNWKRGTIRETYQVVSEPAEWWADGSQTEDFEDDLIERNIPDLSDTPPLTMATSARDLTDEELLAELTFRMRRYGLEKAEGGDGDADATGGSAPMTAPSRNPADYNLIADDTEGDIDDEDPHTT